MPVFFTIPDENNPDPNVNYNTGLMGGMSYNQAQAILNSPGPSFGDIVKQIAPAALAILAPQIAPELFASASALDVAPELDATGSLATQAGTGGTVATDVGLSTLPIETTPTVTSDVLSNTSPQDLANALRSTDVTSPTDLGLTGNEASDLSSFTPTDTSYLNDFAPTDTGMAQLGNGTSLSADASTNPLNPFYNVANPEAQANLGTVSNLVGGGAESNLATLDSLSNPLIPTTGAGIGGSELGATGSIIGSGEGLGVQTLPETLAPTGLNGLTPNDLLSQPTDIPNPSVTVSDVADAAKTAKNIANLLKATNTRQQQLATTQQNLTKSQALSNMLRNQVQGTEAPTPYKAANPFTFTPQQPIQDTLASLLRNNYGN